MHYQVLNDIVEAVRGTAVGPTHDYEQCDAATWMASVVEKIMDRYGEKPTAENLILVKTTMETAAIMMVEQAMRILYAHFQLIESDPEKVRIKKEYDERLKKEEEEDTW